MKRDEVKSLIFELLSELGVGHPDELKWLNAVNQIFDRARKETPSYIYRSEVESLIIGLRGNAVTDEGKTILQKLLSLETQMKTKGVNRLRLDKKTDVNEDVDVVYEGVSVFIPDMTDRRLNTILDLCFFLQDKVLVPIIDKQFTQEEKNTFREIGLAGETFAPDGDSFDKETGTINFYISGIPNRLMKTFLEAIKYYLTDEGIQIGSFKGPEQSRTYKSQVIRIPVLKGVTQDRPPDLSMTYGTAQVIFKDLLGFNDARLDQEDPSFTVPAKELLRQVEMVEDNDYKIQQLVTPDKTEKGRGATIHQFGLKEDWIRNILRMLKEIAEWAIKNDYTNVAVT